MSNPLPSAAAALGAHAPGTRCLSCGYALEGVPFGPCPECGAMHDETLSRRLKVLSRWSSRVSRHSTVPEALLLAVAMVSLVFACGGLTPFAVLALVMPWPFVSLVAGYVVLRVVRADLRPLHRALWMRFQLWLWIPLFIWIPLSIPLVMSLFLGQLWPTLLNLVAWLTIPTQLALAMWVGSMWNTRMNRFASVLGVPAALWPRRVRWMPSALLVCVVLLGSLPGVLALWSVLT